MQIEENSEKINSPCSVDKITLMHHAQGNKKYISVHQTLCEVYDKIFQLEVKYTRSYSSRHSNILIENLPFISYGINGVKYNNFHIFLKKLTNIDNEFEEHSNNELKTLAADVENTILTDLHLYLNFYSYQLGRKKWNTREILRSLYRFLYKPVDTIKSFIEDSKILNEMHKVFHLNTIEEVDKYIYAVNKKIEEYLEKAGGKEYCMKVEKRTINSIDLVIYSAIKTQEIMYRDYNVSGVNFNFVNSIYLVKSLDNIINNHIKIKNEYSILPANELILQRSIPEQFLIFKQYDQLSFSEITEEAFKNEKIKRFFMVAGYFGLLLYLKIKGK